MIRPELEEARKIAEEQEYQIIPISMELYSDLLTPIEVLRKLKNVSKHCYLLESAEDNQNWGRYTFLGYDPKLELTCVDGKVTITAGTKITMETKHPKEQIKQIIEENKSPRFSYLPTFTGGLVGYFSYDYIKYAENLKRILKCCFRKRNTVPSWERQRTISGRETSFRWCFPTAWRQSMREVF